MIIERKEGMKRPLHYKTYLPTHIPNRQARVLVLRGVLFAAATAARCLTPPPPPPPSRRNGAGKHYRVCMHSVIGRHLTPCSCCCCHLAAGTQNFMLMASEADNGNLNGTQSDLLATWLGFCIRRLLFYIWMSCDDDGKGSRQPAGRPPSQRPPAREACGAPTAPPGPRVGGRAELATGRGPRVVRPSGSWPAQRARPPRCSAGSGSSS